MIRRSRFTVDLSDQGHVEEHIGAQVEGAYVEGVSVDGFVCI